MQPHGLTASHGVWSFKNGCKYPKKISLIWTSNKAISLIFLHRAILWVKRIVLVNGSQLTQLAYTVQFRFQNHVYRLFKHFFNVDNVLVWRFKGFDSKSFCLCVCVCVCVCVCFWVYLLAKNPTTNIHGFKSDNFVGTPCWKGLDSTMA